MSKKPREFEVEINLISDEKTEVTINEKKVGLINVINTEFVATDTSQKIIGNFKTQDQAISAIISNFNLNN